MGRRKNSSAPFGIILLFIFLNIVGYFYWAKNLISKKLNYKLKVLLISLHLFLMSYLLNHLLLSESKITYIEIIVNFSFSSFGAFIVVLPVEYILTKINTKLESFDII